MDIAGKASDFWRFARKLLAEIPLRYRLIAVEVALLGVALTVISVTGINYLRNYLMGQQNQQVESQANSLLLQNNVQNYAAAELAGGGSGRHESTQLAADWVSGGKLYRVIYPVSGYSDIGIPLIAPGPSFSPSASWLGLDQPVVVGAQSGSGQWDVISTPMVVVSPNGPVNGMLVVGVNISPVYSTLGRLADFDIFVSVILLLGLLVLGIAIIRGSLRPLADIKETADAVSAGNLAQRMPEAGRRTEFGSAGRSFNKMLGDIEAAARARSSSERAARRSEQRTRNLLADLSHELRTPLTAIRGFAEYCRHRSPADGMAYTPHHRADSATWDPSGNGVSPSHNGAGPHIPADLERIVGRVEQEADRMAALLEDMLLLAELGDEGALESHPVDLLTLTEDAVREARLTAPNCPINVDSSDGATGAADADGALPVAGDRGKLRKAIGIMMKNALAHAPEGTAIDVRIATASRADILAALAAAEAQPDSWPGLTATDRDEPTDEAAAAVLEVADHGRSLTEDASKYAFDRYCRVGAAGSGLDLTVVAAVVKAHGGAAWVRPEATKGTTYCIAVPLFRPASEPDDDQPGAAAEAEGLSDDGLVSGPGMTVSNLAGTAGSGSGVADAGATGDASDEEETQQTWVESGPPDEISFLATSGVSANRADRTRVSGPQGRASGIEGGLPVARSEQANVHEQRVQLVQRDASAPAVCERPTVLIAGQDPAEVRRREQAEHGQVGLPVAAVRGRVDQPSAAT
jgi:two-component system, OmpR family, sensor kinase